MDNNDKAFQKMMFAFKMFLQDDVKIILRNQVEVHRYFPSIPISWRDCLSANSLTRKTSQEVWKDIGKNIRAPIHWLATRVEDVGLVISLQKNTVLGLVYIIKHTIKGESFYEGWLGGLPAKKGEFRQFEKLTGFPLPLSYQAFCSVHNGFLKNGNSSTGYLPTHKLDVNFCQNTLLPFCGDGVGNFQVYNFNKPIGLNEYLTFDWDHETK